MSAPASATALDRFLALPEDEKLIREFDEGTVIEMAPPNLIHSFVAARLCALLHAALGGSRDWRIGQGAGFKLGPAAFRIPDVFVARTTTIEATRSVHGWLEGTPELCIEIVSPNNTAADLDRKIRQFLEAGAHSVWAVYPATRHVVVHRTGGAIHDFGSGDRITDPELLGDDAIEVDAIFEVVPESFNEDGGETS